MKPRTAFTFTLLLIAGTSLAQVPIDANATKKTKALLINLHEIAKVGTMYGHEDDESYGLGWRAVEGRSDVLETSGSYPAIHGWDVGKKLDDPFNIDSVDFEDMKGWMKSASKRGGINTVSWHLDNLTSGSHSWDKTPSVADILPGGAKHQDFLAQMDLLVDYFNDLKKVPIIFRPWHEHNGDWFWWGKGICTEEEYIQLFRFTVDYLRDTKGLHNLLYAFSPDRSRMDLSQGKASYFYGYPGDDYVDIIGLDNYADVGRNPNMSIGEQRENLGKSLVLISEIAREKGKVAALTETGLNGVGNFTWHTDLILRTLEENPDAQIAWLLVWRNAYPDHHFAPYPGHGSEADFKEFKASERIFFESELHKPYKKGKILK